MLDFPGSPEIDAMLIRAREGGQLQQVRNLLLCLGNSLHSAEVDIAFRSTIEH
jgi:hypothetical protein